MIDKQPQLQWLDMETAIEHCTRGASIWHWASNEQGDAPDAVLACAGDIPTLETVAAAHWLRRHVPELQVRVVNVVDLMTLSPREFHPYGMDTTQLVDLFTDDRPVVFAFHGYQCAIHHIVYGQPHAERFHMRGFNEQGTTTTSFDMVMLNGMSRYHLYIEALRRSACMRECAPTLIAECTARMAEATAYAREQLEDLPEIRGRTLTLYTAHYET
ncbi:MAG TPA: hypothetical protein VFO07_08835 [Roseiflexaceae bacterium]|nr:hypothetical protein [Roseiflexaceae bacterium]